MTATTFLAFAATIFGLFMAIGPLLQIGRILRRKHSGDVSILYLSVICAGAAVWASYGFALDNAALIIPNVVGTLTNMCAIAVVWLYRNGSAFEAKSARRAVAARQRG